MDETMEIMCMFTTIAAGALLFSNKKQNLLDETNIIKNKTEIQEKKYLQKVVKKRIIVPNDKLIYRDLVNESETFKKLENKKKENANKKVRRWSICPRNWEKDEKGLFLNKFLQMKAENQKEFYEYTGMHVEQFDFLLNLIKDKLYKRSIRKAISPEERLAMTLYYLSNGCSMQIVAHIFYVGKATVSAIIFETCNVLWEFLSPVYIPKPTKTHWQEIEKRFFEKWNIPNCIGAIDGKHVIAQSQKKNIDVVIIAICDAEYCFTLIDVFTNISENHSTIFSTSETGKAMENDLLNIPSEKLLPGTNINCPHFIIGDEIFPLKTNLMRPYPENKLTEERKIFNYRLSSARNVIDNSFGVMLSRWRIIRSLMIAEPKTVARIIRAVVCLHNFLIKLEKSKDNSERFYCPQNFVDAENDGVIVPGLWRSLDSNKLEKLGKVGANSYARNPATNRDNLMQWFISPNGEVPWQKNHIS